MTIEFSDDFSEFSDEARKMLESLEPDNVGGYAVAIGHAFDGITMYGPFQSYDEAHTFAERVDDDDWHIVPLWQSYP